MGESSSVSIDGEEREEKMTRVRSREMLQDEIVKAWKTGRKEARSSRAGGRGRRREHAFDSFDVVGSSTFLPFGFREAFVSSLPTLRNDYSVTMPSLSSDTAPEA